MITWCEWPHLCRCNACRVWLIKLETTLNSMPMVCFYVWWQQKLCTLISLHHGPAAKQATVWQLNNKIWMSKSTEAVTAILPSLTSFLLLSDQQAQCHEPDEEGAFFSFPNVHLQERQHSPILMLPKNGVRKIFFFISASLTDSRDLGQGATNSLAISYKTTKQLCRVARPSCHQQFSYKTTKQLCQVEFSTPSVLRITTPFWNSRKRFILSYVPNSCYCPDLK